MAYILRSRRISKGSDAAALRKWAILLLATGIVGRSILRDGILGLDPLDGAQLMAALEDNGTMAAATAAIFCGVLETCAVPLFAFLLVEGFLHTSGFEKYLLRVGSVALVSELPYNLAMGGGLLDLQSRNPAFGLVIGLVMLFFFHAYGGKSFRNTLMKMLILLAALLWCRMLRIDQGICTVIFVAALWLVREKSNFRLLAVFAGTMICAVFDFFYLGACLSCMMLHRCTGERGGQNEKLNYAAYPALLLLGGIAAMLLG